MAHFLAPLVGSRRAHAVLRNTRTGAILASTLHPAFDSADRRRGLLGEDGLPSQTALVLAPCAAIHTCFMRFPIDVVFASRNGAVLKVHCGVRPWRVALALGAFAAIEFAGGALVDVRQGDHLAIDVSEAVSRF